MSRSVRLWPRPFLYFLALALVPVLVVASPNVARAAETIAQGPAVTAKWSKTMQYDGPIDARSANCTITGNLRLNDAGVHSVRAKLRCTFGFNFEFDDAVYLKAYGIGDDCALVADSVALTSGEDTDTTLAPVTLHTASGGALPKDCVITTLKVDHFESGYCHTGAGGTSTDGGDDPDRCDSGAIVTPWALGPVPGTPEAAYNGTCNQFTFSTPPKVSQPWEAFPAGYNRDGKYSSNQTLTWPKITWNANAPAPPSSSAVQIFAQYITRKQDTNASGATGSTYLSSQRPNVFASQDWMASTPTSEKVEGVSFGSPFPVVTRNRMNTQFYSFKNVINERVIGVQFYTVNAAHDRTQSTSFPNGRGVYDQSITAAGGDLGTTDPGACRFYWGEKVNTGTPAYADPVGPLLDNGGSGAPTPITEDPITNPTPTDPTDGECSGFKFTDPSSWAGAGICQLVKLIGYVIDAIASLARAIGGLVEALLDGLIDLFRSVFVPSSSHFTDKLNGVKDAWGETAPGQVVKTYTRVQNRLTAPSSLGCAGPTMALDMPLTDSQVRLNLFSTCNPDIAKFAGFARTALLVGIYIAALFLAMRIIASSLGLRVDIGGDD